jgi:hypothetical protein
VDKKAGYGELILQKAAGKFFFKISPSLSTRGFFVEIFRCIIVP